MTCACARVRVCVCVCVCVCVAGTDNIGFRGRKPEVYTPAQLQRLVSYADARGVTGARSLVTPHQLLDTAQAARFYKQAPIFAPAHDFMFTRGHSRAVIPELEGPGHSSAMRRSDPSFNGEGGDTPQGGGVINAANQTVYDGMATIVGEMAAIFKSSPYIHVGCDETGTPPSLPGYGAFAAKHNITDGSDLFAYYVKTMADAVKKTGKQAMIWGPAQMKRLQPGDAVVMSWQGSDGVAQMAEKAGLECRFHTISARYIYTIAIVQCCILYYRPECLLDTRSRCCFATHLTVSF